MVINKNNKILQENLEYSFFSWVKQENQSPLNIARSNGVYLYDQDGKKYLDFSSQVVNVNLGHNHPKIKNAIIKQIDELIYVCTSIATEIRGKLAKKISEITPGDLTKTFFTNGGSDAIDSALKIARLVTGRHKIISRYRSYHGSSYGAFSASGDPRKFLVDREAIPGMVHVEDPYCYRCPWKQELKNCDYDCVQHLERVIKFEGPEQIAAIIMEGESAPASMCIKYPPEYLKRIKEIADRYGILIIIDEVLSGFGRTGKWFGVENHGISPDIIAMGKGLTSGYIPMGAMTVTKNIANFFDNNILRLGSTTSAHALGCAAALECIKVYEEDKIFENVISMGKYLKEQLLKMKSKHSSIGDVRVTGLLGGIELVKNRATREPLVPWNGTPQEMDVMNRVSKKIKELGMFTFTRWNWIYTTPPLIINKEQIDEGLAIISQALKIADEYSV
jgi:taurine--2-oxoglutarate transaminase